MPSSRELGPAPGGAGGAHTEGAGPGGGSDNGNTPTHTGGTDRITIIINNKEYRVDKPSLTGADLKRLAKEPPNRMVIWIRYDSNTEQGGDDEAIPDDKSVNLVAGMKFRIVNAGTFG